MEFLTSTARGKGHLAVQVRTEDKDMNRQTVMHTGGSRRSPDQQPVPGWDSLQHGNCIEVWSNNSFLYLAYVDVRSDDGQLIWVVENGTGGRRLFVRDDPVTLYPV